MLHSDVLNISFTHHYQIKSIFGDILGINGVEHFSLDLVNPAGEMLFFSGTPQHAFEICKRGLGKYDGIISQEYYENFEFYWWSDAAHKAYSEKIKKIREGFLGLKHGFMLVRKWNNFHLIYSFATKQCDPHFQSLVINKINSFLKMGDYAYSMMRETYSIYSGNYEPPLIEKFYSFEGGRPPARYTKNFVLLTQTELYEENNTEDLIIIDFNEMDKKIIQLLIHEITESGDYTLQGIGIHTRIPYEVIYAAAYGISNQFSITLWAKLGGLYMEVKPDITLALINKLIEVKEKLLTLLLHA